MSEIPAGENRAKAAGKLGTASAIIRCVQSLIAPMDDAPNVFKEFWDVVNASGPFTDDELAPLGITAAQLASFITVIENFDKFVTGNSPANDVYRTSLNSARRLSA